MNSLRKVLFGVCIHNMEPNIILQWPSIWSTLFCCVGLFSGLALLISKTQKPLEAANATESLSKTVSRQDGYPKVEPLPDFDWKITEPIKIRPFKPKYNLTMSMFLLLNLGVEIC